ncbi:MAG: hypothetical protein DBP01_18780 [gamma proteobacterium symbiont of Ctena orbiculata]|nr:MAG: hypothetical protein DBP01_18780 [gamma proteobacterium symbiont of Ctena orbiculata]
MTSKGVLHLVVSYGFHVNKELMEKLGRNDPCPCGSGLRF